MRMELSMGGHGEIRRLRYTGCKRHRGEMPQIKQRIYGTCSDTTSVLKDLYHGNDNYINLWKSKSISQ